MIILGAAGRDFHNFNRLYRDHEEFEVVAFTAAQIPNISGRRYPPELAGRLYPDGIPIVPERELSQRIRNERIDRVDLAYSDLPYDEVMHKASIALAAGANFVLPGPGATELVSRRPVVSVCAVRTGAGKSPLSRYVAHHLRARGRRVAVVRHPMPYGDLARQAVQRFATLDDLDRAECTIEEREEYEPHLRVGGVVFAGVDYERILRAAEAEADVVLWDGGNNDLPFFRSNLQFVVADPHRPGHELGYYPGEANFRRADVVVIGKTDTALPANVAAIRANAARLNPSAQVVYGGLGIQVADPERLRGHRTIVIEDGPTVTHGGMGYGAATIVARAHGAVIVDARRFAVGSLPAVYAAYPHLGPILPAMGYTPDQVGELEETIRRSDAEYVLDGSPVDLARLIRVPVPILNVSYYYDDRDHDVARVLDGFVERLAAEP